jgi:hypothetical protein
MILTINIKDEAGAPLVVSIGDLAVNNDLNLTANSTLAFTVANNSEAAIIVHKTGYITYLNTIHDVFSADKTIDIYLVSEKTLLDPDYNTPLSKFFYFESPCSFKVYLYQASSFGDSPTWFLNNIQLGFGKSFLVDLCKPGDFQFKLKTESYDVDPVTFLPILRYVRYYANSLQGNVTPYVFDTALNYLSFDPSLNYSEVEFRPTFQIETSSPVICTEEPCCYSKNEIVTITPLITITRGVESDYTIRTTVVDPLGIVVLDSTQVLILPLAPIQLTTTELGNYTVTMTLADTFCEIDYVSEKIINTCSFLVPSYIDCNSYSIENRSSGTEVALIITDLLNQTLAADNLSAGDVFTITFGSIGLFLMTASYTKPGDTVQTVETYVLNNYCALEDCISDYILNLLCNDPSNCTPCPETTEINRIILLSNTFFMKLEKEFGFNNFYTALDQSKLDQFMSIEKVMNKLNVYCSRRCLSNKESHYGPVSTKLDWIGTGGQPVKIDKCGTSPVRVSSPSNCGCK